MSAKSQTGPRPFEMLDAPHARGIGSSMTLALVSAAALLAALPPEPSPPPPLPPEPLPTTEHTVDFDDVHVTFALPLPAVERPVAMPLHIAARGPASAHGDVHVALCGDWRCLVAPAVDVPVNGAGVDVVTTVWPQGLLVHARYRDEERTCCGAPNRAAHVVATTGTGPVHTSRDGNLLIVPAGDLFARDPALLDGVSGLVAGGAPVDAYLPWVERGGALSIPAREGRAPGISPRGAGVVVARAGARDDAAAAELLAAARPAGAPGEAATAADAAAVHAAAVALVDRPPRLPSFALALAAVLVVALAVGAVRRRGLRAALVVSAAVGVAASAALWAFEAATVPREVRARVVTWTGPGAAFEVGADAARPRSEGRVSVEAPVPLAGVTVVGDAAAEAPSVDGKRASAIIRSSSGLVGVWTRPAPRTNAVRIDGDDVVNDLDVPLDGVFLRNGDVFTHAIPAHGRRARASFTPRRRWDVPVPDGLPAVEQRLLTDVTAACANRGIGGDRPPPARCGAAVARLKDGTVLGVELSQ